MKEEQQRAEEGDALAEAQHRSGGPAPMPSGRSRARWVAPALPMSCARIAVRKACCTAIFWVPFLARPVELDSDQWICTLATM